MFGVQRIGRYEVLNHLASGGMGQVYLARATGLGGFERQVVVKTLDLSITDDDDDAFVTMFLDEARLVGALHHQYIAPVYEVGCDEEGRYYLVMDYVHGETAETVFRVSSERMLRVPLAFSLTVVSCVASALDYAHGLCAADGTPLDIVHRDVSLSNVVCGHDGAVKLIDFGIAKAANRATTTQVGTLKGKIGYLAPEQILRQPVDHRADIFALGIVLYELTTATRAFRENSDLVTLERITKGDIRRPTEFIADYPPELERIVMKALATDPARRFQDADAMGRAIEALASKMSIPLGHAAIADVMGRLFTEQRGRRRMARGSNEVKTDPTVSALTVEEDEMTPITDIGERDVSLRAGVLDGRIGRAQRPTIPEPARAQRALAIGVGTPPRAQKAPIQESARSQRPTTPMIERKSAEIPLEDRPTPIAEPAAQLRARNALIPLEDRPTPMAEPALIGDGTPELQTSTASALSGSTITALCGSTITALAGSTITVVAGATITAIPPTPAALPPPPAHRKLPTGPQQPLAGDSGLDDAPTVIAASGPDREDPTDVKATDLDRPNGRDRLRSPLPALASPPSLPIVRFTRERNLATAVVSRMRVVEDLPTRTWLVLCGMFVIAVLAACVVALL